MTPHPLTDREHEYSTHGVTLVCSAGKTFILAFTWILFCHLVSTQRISAGVRIFSWFCVLFCFLGISTLFSLFLSYFLEFLVFLLPVLCWNFVLLPSFDRFYILWTNFSAVFTSVSSPLCGYIFLLFPASLFLFPPDVFSVLTGQFLDFCLSWILKVFLFLGFSHPSSIFCFILKDFVLKLFSWAPAFGSSFPKT